MATKTWTRLTGTNSWMGADDWSPAGTPDGGDDAVFDGGQAGDVYTVVEGGTVRSVSVVADTVTFQSGTVTVVQDAQGSGGVLSVTGGASVVVATAETLTVAGTIVVGDGSGDARLSAVSGGTISANTLLVGSYIDGGTSSASLVTGDFFSGGGVSASDIVVGMFQSASIDDTDHGSITAQATEIGPRGILQLDPTSVYRGGLITLVGGELLLDSTIYGIQGSNTLGNPLELAAGSSEIVATGTLTLSGTVSGDGTVDIIPRNGHFGGADVVLAGLSGSFDGVLRLHSNTQVEIRTVQTLAAATVTFDYDALGSEPTLIVDELGDFPETLAGFESAGLLELTALPYVAGATSATVHQGRLVVTDGSATASFLIADASEGDVYAVAADYSGTIVAACYCPGTLILTDGDETPVEALAIGDTVVTASGEHRPVRWIGHRSYSGRFLTANPGLQPVLLRAGSLGDGLPGRDLRVSPLHAMFLDGVLVPAGLLVNGSTIVREQVERVDYLHVELDRHDLLLAEGAPSESYVDDDNRSLFHNAAERAAMYPGWKRQPAVYCAPRVESGFTLEAVRARLAMVAGEVARAA